MTQFDDAATQRDGKKENSPGDNAGHLATRIVFNTKMTAHKAVSGTSHMALAAAVATLAIGPFFWWKSAPDKGDATRPIEPPPTRAYAESTTAIPTADPSANAPRQQAVQTTPHTTLPPHAAITEKQAERCPAPPKPIKSVADRAHRLPKTHAFQGQESLKTQATPPQARATSDPIAAGYAALRNNQLEDAQHYYTQSLGHDRRDTDALLGLAVIALRREKPDDALALFQQALVSDPNNATAQAAIANLAEHGDLALIESRLKATLADHPDSPSLRFALGNQYARQQRWSEAQEAYFTAFTLDPENGDYAFNLAVSLDHLHHETLAERYYQRALSSTKTNGAGFDPDQVRRRLSTIQAR